MSASPAPAAKGTDTSSNRFQPIQVQVFTAESKTIAAGQRWAIDGSPTMIDLESLTIGPGGSLATSPVFQAMLTVDQCNDTGTPETACGLDAWFADGTGATTPAAARVSGGSVFWFTSPAAIFGLANHTDHDITLTYVRFRAG